MSRRLSCSLILRLSSSGALLMVGMRCCASGRSTTVSGRKSHQPSAVTAELPFDADFEERAFAARRLWRAMNGRLPGPAFRDLSKQRRERLGKALRALDAQTTGSTYRAIAEVLFGKTRVPDCGWKTHDLRNRTIRLVQTGVALVRGGYRRLLRSGRREK